MSHLRDNISTVTNEPREPEIETDAVDTAVIVTHDDGTQERFPVRLSRVRQPREGDEA